MPISRPAPPRTKQATAEERNHQARQADLQHHQHPQGTCPGLPMNWRSTTSYEPSRLCSGSPRHRRRRRWRCVKLQQPVCVLAQLHL
ncbi:hypothetical protein V8C35DRAFT_292380 [Trichoderma chlorosporum]